MDSVKLALDVAELRLELQEGAAGRGKVLLELLLGRSQLLDLIFTSFPVPSSVIALGTVPVRILLGCGGAGKFVVALADQVDT
jgi:hypothetical protein